MPGALVGGTSVSWTNSRAAAFAVSNAAFAVSLAAVDARTAAVAAS